MNGNCWLTDQQTNIWTAAKQYQYALLTSKGSITKLFPEKDVLIPNPGIEKDENYDSFLPLKKVIF